MLNRRTVLAPVATLLLLSKAVQAQQLKKIPHIGFLTALPSAAVTDRLDAFRQGLTELGYVEGKNIQVEYRFGDGKVDQIPRIASEMIDMNLDVIVSAGPVVSIAFKKATSTIPIVLAFDNDPVGSGFVSSLAKPGGNITGLSTLSPDLSAKQLEILKEMLPSLRRVTVFGNLSEPGNSTALKITENAAEKLKLSIQYVDVADSKDIEVAFGKALIGRAQAVLILQSAVTLSRRPQIVELAAKNKLPVMYTFPEFIQDGGLMSYGVSYIDLFRRSASFVDKILKGRPPTDLPVEQPLKFEFIVNLKTARSLGLTVPQTITLRADKLIN
jgi:putative tryptophan/tyrosine transport system substrate-binding protein